MSRQHGSCQPKNDSPRTPGLMKDQAFEFCGIVTFHIDPSGCSITLCLTITGTQSRGERDDVQILESTDVVFSAIAADS